MSGRSSPHSILIVLAAAACSHKPDADPERIRQLAGAMIDNMPAPLAVRECTAADYTGLPTATMGALFHLAGRPSPGMPEDADWINTPALDAPAVRTLIAGGELAGRREAAGELLAAPGWLVYRIDMVNAPLALAVKELKIGTVGARAIRYDRNGHPVCVKLFYFQNDKAKSDWAIEKSNKAYIEPEVAKAMRDDLVDQLLKHAPRG